MLRLKRKQTWMWATLSEAMAVMMFEGWLILCKTTIYMLFFCANVISCGAMVARLTSNQKAAGSSPASGVSEICVIN